MLRFPDGMRDRLKDEAAKHKRSLNAEIIARLEATLVGDVMFPEGVNPLEEYTKEVTQAATRAATDAALIFIKAALSGNDIEAALKAMSDDHLNALGDSVAADEAKTKKPKG